MGENLLKADIALSKKPNINFGTIRPGNKKNNHIIFRSKR